MATDGSLRFDTKINTEGFIEGTGNLLKAAERLTSSIDNLASKMDRAFASSGMAASATARDVDKVTDSARRASEEMERLQRERDATFSGTIVNNNAPTPSPYPDDGVRRDIYGNDVDAAIARNRELEEAARRTGDTVDRETEREKGSIVGLKESLRNAVNAFKQMPGAIVSLFRRAGETMDGTRVRARTLQDEIDRYTDALHYAETSGYGLGDRPYDEAYAGLIRARRRAEEYRNSLAGVDNNQKKVASSAGKMSSRLGRTNKAAIPLTKSILKLSNMFKLMLIRMAMRAAIQGIRDGFKNLARYSDDTNKSLSQLMSAGTKFKNSFATAISPALQACTPALKRMIDLLSAGATYAGQFLAAMTGRSTFVKAVDVEEDYAASLKETNDELKEKEKETKKLAFAFDDLIQAQGDNTTDADLYKPPTPDQMFETVEVETDIKAFAETVKGVLSDLFEPMRKSWDENGSTVITSAKYALGELKNLGKDVGNSFMTVWEKEGYGKRITDDVLISVSNLFDAVGNLARGFDQAWMSGNTGTAIMRHLGDIVLEITGFFRKATESIKNWTSELDFTPLLKSFDQALVSTKPIVNKIGSLLLWLLDDILEPIAKWGIEQVLPEAFNLIAAALDVLNSVLEALQPLAIWLWKEFLQPLGKWAGEIFIAAMQKIVEWLKKFSDWILQHRGAVQDITLAVLSFFAAWKVAEFVSKISTMMGKIGELISKLGTLDLKFMAIVTVIGSIIYLAVKVAQAWNKMTPGQKVATALIAVAGAIALVVAAVAAFTKDYATLLIAGSIAAIAGLSIAGIASSASKRGSDGSSRVNSLSARGFTLMNQALPRLATGTVVPPRAGEFAAILGDNNRDTEIVSPIPAMKQAFKEAMEEMGGFGGGNQTLRADLIVDGTKFGQLVYKFNNKEKQRVGVRMVTEG